MSLERDDHAAVVAWLREVAPLKWPGECMDDGLFPFLVSLSAGKRSGLGIGWAKQQGLEPGWCDFQIPIPRGGFSGCWIELKRSEGRAVVSAAQKVRLGWLNLHGHCARVCYGKDAAIKLIEQYMQGRVE